jgi:hypothetical protein
MRRPIASGHGGTGSGYVAGACLRTTRENESVTAQQFEAALGIAHPEFIQGLDLDAGSELAVPGIAGEPPAHDTVTEVRAYLKALVVQFTVKCTARAWAYREQLRTRYANGLLEASNGLIEAAKVKARGCGRCSILRTVTFLIASVLDFSRFDPHAP